MTGHDSQGRDLLLPYSFHSPRPQLSTDTTYGSTVEITVHLYHVNSQFVQVLQKAYWIIPSYKPEIYTQSLEPI